MESVFCEKVFWVTYLFSSIHVKQINQIDAKNGGYLQVRQDQMQCHEYCSKSATFFHVFYSMIETMFAYLRF